MNISIERIRFSEEHPLSNRNWKVKNSTRNSKFKSVVLEKGDHYILLVGAKRFLSMKDSGGKYMNCKVIKKLSRREQLEFNLSECYLCTIITPMEMGRAMLKHREQYGLTQQELAKRTGIAAGTIHHYESLIHTLSPELGRMLEDKRLTFKEARCIADINDHTRQREIAEPFLNGYLSSVHVEKVVRWAKKLPNTSAEYIAESVKKGEEPRASRENTHEEGIDKKHLEEIVISTAGLLEELQLHSVPEYRRLKLVSSLRILDSRLQSALSYLSIGSLRSFPNPSPLSRNKHKAKITV